MIIYEEIKSLNRFWMTQPQKSKPKTQSGQQTEKLLNNIWDSLDKIGKALMNDLWRTFYLSVQDAIALSCLLQIPGLIGHWILGKDFSSFDVCLQENPLGASRYACFIIVASNFLLWIVLAGRIVGRFWEDISCLWEDIQKNRQGKEVESSQKKE
jgi:large-conductance mechanosensitive channel